MSDSIEKRERKKYLRAWEIGAEGQSRTAKYILSYIEQFNPKWKMLELGCGNGFIIKDLRKKGFNIIGTDIVSVGLKEKFIEACIWDLPFKSNSFDFTFSTDVLEHIPPELIDKTIKEIFRVTRFKTFHCIATFKDNRRGFEFHLTVKPIEWWKKKFTKLNTKHLDLDIISRRGFLRKYI